MGKPTVKTVDPSIATVIEKVPVYRITIDPRLDIYELLLKIRNDEKKGLIQLLSVGYEGGIQTRDSEKIKFGKDGKVVLKITPSAIFTPKKVIKLTDNYTINDLINAVEELDKYRMATEHAYLNIYPISMDILDKGNINKALTLVKFRKERRVDKTSEVGEMLSGMQTMPLDAMALYIVSLDSKTGKYIKGETPSVIAEEMTHYKQGEYVLSADHVQNYTRNIYHTSFTVKRKCLVGKERKTVDLFFPIDGGQCQLVDK